jgi:hypothetical protein
MENPCQSMTMFCVVWFIVMSVSVWLMEPLPAVTLPPVGRVPAMVAAEERKRDKITEKHITIPVVPVLRVVAILRIVPNASGKGLGTAFELFTNEFPL